jgi:hypothetical protein
MNIPYKLFESNNKNNKMYLVQKSVRYTDREDKDIETFNEGLYEDKESAVKKLEKMRQIEAEFCKYNTYSKHVCTYKILELEIKPSEVYTVSDSYEKEEFNNLTCGNCNGEIRYGDDVIVTEDGKVFCCYDCLEQAGYFTKYEFSSSCTQYDNLFKSSK